MKSRNLFLSIIMAVSAVIEQSVFGCSFLWFFGCLRKNATFATAKIFLRTYLRRILSLYDLLNGDGIGGGNILKKRLLTLCFDYRNFEHSDMSSEHSNDRCHIVC